MSGNRDQGTGIVVSNFNFNQQNKLTHNKLSPGFRSPTPLILLLILLLLSCSTTPLINTSTHASVQEVTPNWERFDDGIWYMQGKLSSPKIDYYALRVELSTPYLSVFAGGSAGTLNEPGGRSFKSTVSEFVSENNLIAGINANPFAIIAEGDNKINSSRTPTKGRPDENYNNIGLVVSDGEVLSPVNKSYDALVFYKDGGSPRAIIVKQDSIYTTANIDNAVGGFFRILTEGEPAQRVLRNDEASARRHPRTAAGVSSNGSVLYLLVIDGRRPGSIGATEQETALLLRALGSYDGINLDGGGSSSMVLRFSGGDVRVMNRPSEFGRERKVAAKLGISLSTEK